MKWWKLFNSYDANFNITISFQKWLADNMGQVDSKRPMPSIQVQSLQTAHLPEKPRTPTPAKALLNVPKQHIRQSGANKRLWGFKATFFVDIYTAQTAKSDNFPLASPTRDYSPEDV